MAKLSFGRKAANNPVIRIFVLDSSKTDGSGLTALTSGSSGLKINVMRELDAAPTLYSQAGGTIEAVSVIGTYSAPTATKCRFIKIDDTNLPGWYEIQFAQALFGTGDASRFVGGMAFGVANMAPTPFEVELEAVDSQDAVRMALTALPNAAAGASGGLPTGNASGQVTVGGYASGQAPLQPTTAGRTLDVAATGEAGLDFDNIHDASGAHTLSNITVPTTTDVTTKTGYALISGYDPAKTAAQAGDAMALTTGERTTLTAAIWNALTPGLTTASSIGKLLVDNINATIGSRSSHSAADVWAVVTRVLTAGTNIVLAKGTGVTGFNDLDAAGVRGAVGLASANLDTQLDALPTAAENADAIWDEARSGHTTAGTFGEGVASVVGSVGSVAGTVAANLTQILGTAFTEGAVGRMAAAFKQFFNIASPAATMDHLILVDTATAVTNRVTANTDQIEGADATDQIRDAVLSDGIRFAGADIATIKGRLPSALTLAGNIKADLEEWRAVVPEALVGSPGLVQTDVEFWLGHAPIAPDVDGLPIVQPLHRYSATVRVVRDEVGTTDRYEVVWLRDGEPFTGTITTPKIEVLKQSDGSDLIAYTTLPASPIGLGYLYEATGAELQIDGQGYLVYLDATIDGSLRQAWAPVGVDTSAVDAAIKAKTDLLPADPASESAVEGAIGGLNNLSTTDVDAALTAYGAAKTSDVPTLGEIGDEVWDETLSDHLAVGSTGEALNGAGAAGDPWATPLPGAYGAGTAGKLVGDNLDAPVGSRAVAGDAMALTSGERTTLTAAIWAASVRSLTTFGTLVTDIWGNAGRTLTSGANIVLTKGVELLGLNDLSSADVTAALEAAEPVAANLTQWRGVEPLGVDDDGLIQTNVAKINHGDIRAPVDGYIPADVGLWNHVIPHDLNGDGFVLADVYDVQGADAHTAIRGDVTAAIEAEEPIDANVVSGVPTADDNADALLDRADAIEVGWTLRKILRLMASALAGRTTGGHTNTIHFRDLNDAKNRIVATTDLDATGSDRTSVTLDGD